MPGFQTKLDKPRKLSKVEWKIINKMLSADFEGKDILINQLKTAKVISYCSCGCQTIDICCDESLPLYINKTRVPVELTAISKDGIPIIASLHIVNGYICELEIYRVDSKRIEEDINFDNSVVNIY